jgi:K+-transporting ATPase KdpF subunit
MHGNPEFLGFRKGLQQTLRRNVMDYIIAGAVSICLFIYLTYALLKPERF